MDSSTRRRSKRLQDKETERNNELSKKRLQEKETKQNNELSKKRLQEKQRMAELRKKMRFYEMSPSYFCSMVEDHRISDAELESVIAACPDLLMCPDAYFTKPIHAACSLGRSYKFIELLVCENPRLLHTVNNDGQIPMHILFRFHKKYHVEDMLLILELMIDFYPTLVQFQDHFDNTPLHMACECNAPLPVIAYLTRLYPQSLQIHDIFHRTPFFHACEGAADLSTIQLLYTAFPLAGQWKDRIGRSPILVACRSGASLETIKYIAFECCPVDCLMQFTPKRGRPLSLDLSPEVEACWKEMRNEAMSAFIDVAIHTKQILPESMTKEIAQNVESCFTMDGSTNSTRTLSPNQYMGLVLDESARWGVDCLMAESILECVKLKCLLNICSKTNRVYDLLDSVIRMNRAGRQYLIKDANNKVKGMKVLQAASGLDALFFHLRENPALCKLQ